MAYVQQLLLEIGLEKERVSFYNLSSAEGPRFAQIAAEITERVRSLGPNPLRSAMRGPEAEPGGTPSLPPR